MPALLPALLDEGAWDSYKFPAIAAYPIAAGDGPTGRPDAQLADYQQQALDAMTVGLAAKDTRRALVTVPAGYGLIRPTLEWALRAVVAEKRRVLWVSHRVDRLNQVQHDLIGLRYLLQGRRKKLEVSRCERLSRELGGDVALASLEALTAPEPTPRAVQGAGRKLGVVVYDEPDPALAPRVLELLGRLAGERVPILALAPYPPESPPALALRSLFGALLFARTFRELRGSGHLARPIFVPVPVPRVTLPSPKSLPPVYDDVPEAVLMALGRDPARTRAIVQHWLHRAGRYGKTLVVGCDLDHAEALARAFQEQGVASEALHGGITGDERQERVHRFRKGRIGVLATAGRIPAGEVVADVETVLLARPTLSPAHFLAMLAPAARGPRVAPGKDTFHVLECADDLGGRGALAGATVVPWIEDDIGRDLPVAGTPSPEELQRRTVAMVGALAFIESRGLDPAQARFFGELVWRREAGGERGAVVPRGTLGAFEEALDHVRTGLGLGAWRAAEQHGAMLASLGAMRAPDWDDLVAEVKATGRPPVLTRIPDLEATDGDHLAARLLLSLAHTTFAAGVETVRARCDEELANNPEVLGRFPDGATLAREVLALVAHLFAQAEASAPTPTAAPWDDIEAFTSLGMAVGRADGELTEAERGVVRAGATRVFQLQEPADLARLTSALARWETGALDTGRAARRLRGSPFGLKLAMFDWLLHVAIADTRFSEEERLILSGFAALLGISQDEYKRRCAWYLEIDPSIPVEPVPGVRTCTVCGSSFSAEARFCGDCGASLGG